MRVNVAILLVALASQPSTSVRLDVDLEADLSSTVEPAELTGLWMNSKGELVQCTPNKCVFVQSENKDAYTLARGDFRGAPAVSLGSTGWKAIRANRAGIAWRRLNSKGVETTTWWDKLPNDAQGVLSKMEGTRWHNDVGQTILIKGTRVCFKQSQCHRLQVHSSQGFIYFNNWVLIDYFKNTRGNMEVHWRGVAGKSSLAGRDIAWYTNSMMPVAGTFTGTWMNTEGQIAECGNGQCAFTMPPSKPHAMRPASNGVALGSTGWVAIDFDQAGVTWEKGSETTWWNKLPENPQSVIAQLTRVHEWTNTDGQRIVVGDGCVFFNGGSCKSLTASGGRVVMDASRDWVVCDMFENKNGQLEVLWRQAARRGEVKEQDTVRWYQKNLD